MPLSKATSTTKKTSAATKSVTEKKAVTKKAPAKSSAKATSTKAASPKPSASKSSASVTPKTVQAPAKAAPVKNKAAKPNGATSITPEQRYRMICDAAYFRAERRGFIGGNTADDWTAAEAEIDSLLISKQH